MENLAEERVKQMPTEAEKRLHRCCFSGHRPEKLTEDENTVKAWLKEQIQSAIGAGFTTFISGCAMGVDIWAAQVVMGLRDEEKVKKGSSLLRLIAATPWPGFANKWSLEWQIQYSELLKNADLIVPVCKHYHKDVFQQRNEWMVDHSARVIAYYNGEPGGPRNMIEYAQQQGVEVVTNNPEYVEKIRKPRKTELALKLTAAEEIRKQLSVQKKRYPLMNEEDVVKFVFQGMLGVGHLISDASSALERLKAEMESLEEAGEDEKLVEKISPQWVRMNLRTAKKEGIAEADIAYMLVESAKKKGLSFTRQNVYNFCVKMDGSATMKAAAEKVLDERWLPSHSEAYRAAYHPAYRVLYKDYRKFRRESAEDEKLLRLAPI